MPHKAINIEDTSDKPPRISIDDVKANYNKLMNSG
jgi:hypothetical protein